MSNLTEDEIMAALREHQLCWPEKLGVVHVTCSGAKCRWFTDVLTYHGSRYLHHAHLAKVIAGLQT